MLTSLQTNAPKKQKWPLLNLVRQVLRYCHYKMTPKRVSAGYTKDGKKILGYKIPNQVWNEKRF